MATNIAVRSARFPIHKIRLEGFGKPSPANSPTSPLPAIDMESTPYGHIRLKIEDKEVVLTGDVLLRAVATLSPTAKT